MKISLKQILAVGALAVASTSAFADVAKPSTNNGELTLVVWDVTTGASYARGLQVNMNDIGSQSAVNADVYSGYGDTSFNLPSAFNLAPDANLSSFLTGHAGDELAYTVVGGAYDGLSGNAAGNKRYVSTSATPIASNMQTALLNSKFNGLEGWDNTINGNVGTGVAGDGASTATAGLPQVFTTWNGVFSSLVSLGSTANFYMITSNGGTNTALVRVYSLSGLTLGLDGTLTGGPAGPVTPIPAAFWLLGTGLAGLVGIGRRKQVA